MSQQPAVQVRKYGDLIPITLNPGRPAEKQIAELVSQHGSSNVLVDGKPAEVPDPPEPAKAEPKPKKGGAK